MLCGLGLGILGYHRDGLKALISQVNFGHRKFRELSFYHLSQFVRFSSTAHETDPRDEKNPRPLVP